MDSDQKTAQITARIEAQQVSDMKQDLVHRKYKDKVLDGTLIFGPPVDRRQKYAVQVAKDILAEQKLVVKKEIFEFTCPADWAFYYSTEKGWVKFFLYPIKQKWVRGDL